MDNKECIKAYFNAMNTGDTNAVTACFHESGRIQTMGRTAMSGRFSRGQISDNRQQWLDHFPQGLSLTPDNMVTEGNFSSVQAHAIGMHSSGKLYSNEYHFLFVFKDGKIIELKEYMDTERVAEILAADTTATKPSYSFAK